MTPLDDWQLLDDYVASGSHAAFDGLVKRHAGWVYATARRRVASADLADDVTQATFIVLARKAGSISRRESLAAWLYRVANYAALDALRRQNSRRRHERLAARPEATMPTETDNDAIGRHLDAALNHLSGRDREAIILRYFNDQTLEQIGRHHRVAASTVQRRIERSLAQIGYHLKRNDVLAEPTVIATALAATATCTAPASATAGLTALATAAGALPTNTASPVGLAKGTLKTMFMIKLKFAAVTFVALIVLGAGGVAIVHPARKDNGIAAAAIPATAPIPAAPAPSAAAVGETEFARSFTADWNSIDLQVTHVNPKTASQRGQTDSQTLGIHGAVTVVDPAHVLGFDRFDSGEITRILDDNGHDLTSLAKGNTGDMRWYQPLMYGQQFDNSTKRFVDMLQPQNFNLWLKVNPSPPKRLSLVQGYLNVLVFDRDESVNVPFIPNGPPVSVLGVRLHFASVKMDGDNFIYELRADDPDKGPPFDGQMRPGKSLPERMVAARYFVDAADKPVGPESHPFGNFPRASSLDGSGGTQDGNKIVALRFDIAVGLHEQRIPFTLRDIDVPQLSTRP